MDTESSVSATQTIHHEPGPKVLQHERRDQAGRKNTEAGSGVKQAEQKICPLGARLRDRCRQRGTADKSSGRANAGQQSRKAQHIKLPEMAESASEMRAARVPQRTVWASLNAGSSATQQGAGEITDRIDRVHEAGRGI